MMSKTIYPLLLCLATALSFSSLLVSAQTRPPPTRPRKSAYYTVRRDTRKCASPFCGGYWVNRVNLRRTRCLDGTWSKECYVESLDFSAKKLSEADQRRFAQEIIGGVLLGTFVATATGADFLVKDGFTPFEPSPVEPPTPAPQQPDCSACSEDEACIYDTRFRCIGCGCPTICVKTNPFCGGIANIQCPKGLTCVDDPSDECDVGCGGADCGGVCVSIVKQDESCQIGNEDDEACGVNMGCFDNPNDTCTPGCGEGEEKECKGVCADEIGKGCGGLLGIQCGPGLMCADVIGDGCDPQCEPIADCMGKCIPNVLPFE